MSYISVSVDSAIRPKVHVLMTYVPVTYFAQSNGYLRILLNRLWKEYKRASRRQ